MTPKGVNGGQKSAVLLLMAWSEIQPVQRASTKLAYLVSPVPSVCQPAKAAHGVRDFLSELPELGNGGQV